MEEGTEKYQQQQVLLQLMMFISIYYAPLHLALDRPLTIFVPFTKFNVI